MDSNTQYPTMWTTGFVGGIKVSFTFPIRNEMEAYAQAKAITDKLLADGFTTTEPGLEAGEQKEPIGWIARRAKSDGTPVLDLYLDNEKWVNRLVMCYLDDAEGIKAFEQATGLSVNDIPLYEGERLERGNTDKSKRYVIRVPKTANAIIKDNPHYNPDETDIKRKKPARLFIRWDAGSEPTPPAAQAAVAAQPGKATALGEATTIDHTTGAIISAERVTGDEPLQARLENEQITITRAVKTGAVAGVGNKAGDKYDAYGVIVDGGAPLEVLVKVFPEDVVILRNLGYEFGESDNLSVNVILTVKDRNMTRINTEKIKPRKGTPADSLNWGLVWPKVRPMYKSTEHMQNSVNNLKHEGAFKNCADEAAAIAVIVAHKNGQAEGVAG